jgi:hypothetical protein
VPQDADKKSGSKKGKKTVELDEKLWAQTQLSVSSWADCDDEESFDNPQPSADAGTPKWRLKPWRGALTRTFCAHQRAARRLRTRRTRTAMRRVP